MCRLLFVALNHVRRTVDLHFFTRLVLLLSIFMAFKFFSNVRGGFNNFAFEASLNEVTFFILALFNRTLAALDPGNRRGEIGADHINLIVFVNFETVTDVFVIADFFIILVRYGRYGFWAFKLMLLGLLVLLRDANQLKLKVPVDRKNQKQQHCQDRQN